MGQSNSIQETQTLKTLSREKVYTKLIIKFIILIYKRIYFGVVQVSYFKTVINLNGQNLFLSNLTKILIIKIERRK